MLRLFSRGPKIVVLRALGGVGDLLMLTPVFRGLKHKYPGCHVTAAVTYAYGGGALRDLLQHNPFVDEIVRVEPNEFATGMLRAARSAEFGNTPRDWTPPCVAQADLVIDLSVVCSIVETRQQPHVTSHRTDIWCEAARVAPSCRRPVLRLTREELAEGARWCDERLGEGTRVGVVLNTKSGILNGVLDVRGWPHVEAFARVLMGEGYRTLTIDSVRKCDGVPYLIGKRIREVAAIVAHLDAVVTPDTGLLHVAGALGVPILGLFGSTDPAMRMREYCGHYSVPDRIVECGPCWYTTPCLRGKDPPVAGRALCMRRLSPGIVLDELRFMLARFGR